MQAHVKGVLANAPHSSELADALEPMTIFVRHSAGASGMPLQTPGMRTSLWTPGVCWSSASPLDDPQMELLDTQSVLEPSSKPPGCSEILLECV